MSKNRLIAAAATLALLAVPGIAAATQPTTHGNSANHAATPGPDASSKAKGKAYGKFCQTESKKHVSGQKGTPFSQCVTAMAKLASGDAKSAKAACKGMSKKHVEGQKGTPFSQCIHAANDLRKSQKSSDDSTSGDDSTSTSGDTPTPDTTPTA